MVSFFSELKLTNEEGNSFNLRLFEMYSYFRFVKFPKFSGNLLSSWFYFILSTSRSAKLQKESGIFPNLIFVTSSNYLSDDKSPNDYGKWVKEGLKEIIKL